MVAEQEATRRVVSREERQYMVCNRGFLLDATATEPVKASSGGGSPSGDFPPGRLLLAAGRWGAWWRTGLSEPSLSAAESQATGGEQHRIHRAHQLPLCAS